FTCDLTGTATPLASETNLPPVAVELHARGDTNFALIHSARISAPWLRAELSRDLRVNFRGKVLPEPAQLNIAADLTQQPWLATSGSLTGQAEFSPTEGKLPRINFQLAGTGISGWNLTTTNLLVRGILESPLLSLNEFRAHFADGSVITGAGNFDLPDKRIE